MQVHTGIVRLQPGSGFVSGRFTDEDYLQESNCEKKMDVFPSKKWRISMAVWKTDHHVTSSDAFGADVPGGGRIPRNGGKPKFPEATGN